tara:strand:+ start:774 stop:1016 length:243 start_codon:yes stop_codon:yes gene_type:complete
MIALFAKLDRLIPRVETDRYIMKKTAIIVTGKAKEKILSVGAERVITPIETFIRSKTITKGSIITAAELNIKPPAERPAE